MSSLPRQSDEPTILCTNVSREWQLLRCECGNSFGSRGGSNGICSRCGSTRFQKVSEFGDSRQLAEAVSKANLPKELEHDISSRIRTKENINENISSISGSFRSSIFRAMHNATDEKGILNIHSLQNQLSLIGIQEPSSEYIIGQAELEGILIRNDVDSWTWLQQSS